MKKQICFCLTILLVSVLSFPVFAQDFSCPGAGMTFHLPESYQNLEGTLYLEDGEELNSGMYFVMPLYVAMSQEEYDDLMAKGSGMTEEEQQKLQEAMMPLCYFFTIKEGKEEELRSILDASFETYNLSPAGEAGEWGSSYCTFEVEDLPFEEVYAKEYASLVENLENLAQAAEYYEPISPYAEYMGKKVEFETTDIEGNPVTSEEIFGQADVTLVNIWTSWCPWCVKEMGDLAGLHESMAEKGGAVVTILYDAKEEGALDTAKGILEDNNATFPTLIVPENVDENFLVTAFPTTYLVDREGKIVGEPVVGAAFDEYVSRMENYMASLPKEEGAEGEEASEEVAEEAAEEAALVENGLEVYRVFVKDEAGEPVSGVMVQFCSESLCMMEVSDEDGMASFDNKPDHYTVHMLRVPEGFAGDETEYEMLDTYSDLTVVLKSE